MMADLPPEQSGKLGKFQDPISMRIAEGAGHEHIPSPAGASTQYFGFCSLHFAFEHRRRGWTSASVPYGLGERIDRRLRGRQYPRFVPSFCLVSFDSIVNILRNTMQTLYPNVHEARVSFL
jgi:hypothetical protein